jgi:hypothetical protein
MSRRRAIAYWCVLGGIYAFLAIVAVVQPPEGDDWDLIFFVERHGRGFGSLGLWAAHHHSFGDLVDFFSIAFRAVSVFVTPAVVCVLMVGIVAVAMGRVPRPRDRDGWLYVLTASAFVWIGAPRTGLDFYNRSYVAVFGYGLTALVWLLFAFTRQREVRGGAGRAVAIFVLAIAAGSANHYLFPITAIAVWKSIRVARRTGPVPAWMWSGAAGAVLGGVLVFSSKPYLELRVFLGGGFEHNIYRLYLFMGECGELISLVMVILFALALRARLRPQIAMTWPGPREIGIAGWAFGAGMAASLLSVLTPRWGEASMLASVAGFTIASLALLSPAIEDRALRIGLALLGVIVHALVVIYTAPHFVALHDQWTLRQHELAQAPPGGVAHITPYPYTTETSWSLGDDLSYSHRRSMLAGALGLRAIEYTTPIGGEEGTPDLVFDEIWPDGTRARLLTGDLDVAREIFDEDVADHAHGAARLEVVGGLDWPGRDGRRLIAERAKDGDIITPDYGSRTDRNGRMGFHAVAKSLDGSYPFPEIVVGGDSLPFTWDHREFWFFPERNARYTHLQCNLDECWVVQTRWANLLLVN